MTPIHRDHERTIGSCVRLCDDLRKRVDCMEVMRLPKIEVTEIRIDGKLFRLAP